MHTLIRNICILTSALSVLLAAIIGATYRDTNRFTYLFTKPDGGKCETPCILGVELAKQTFEEADLLLSNHPALRGAERKLEENSLIVYKTSIVQAYLQKRQVRTSPTDSYVYTLLEIKFVADIPSLSDIMVDVGKPIGYRDGGDGLFACRLIELYMKTGTYALSTNENDTCLRINQRIDFAAVYSPEAERKLYYIWTGFNQNRRFDELQEK
jgi:hypothetical protein